MSRILFLSSGHAGRNYLACSVARACCPDDVRIEGADRVNTSVPAVCREVLAGARIDLCKEPLRAFDEVERSVFDLVVAIDRETSLDCPRLPGNPQILLWPIDMPPGSGDEGADAANILAELQRRIGGLCRDGYLESFRESRRLTNRLLDHVSDGIMAHDMNRKIFCFNKGAEEITGYRAEEVLGRDCHDVFPGNFCGGKCLFCETEPPDFDVLKRDLEIVTKSGEARHVAMTVSSLGNDNGRRLGVLGSFRDMTRENRLARRAGEIEQFSGIIGRDEKMLEVFELIDELADSNVPVLIHGESGTGKELVAAAIHNEGMRANKLFVPVNCGALPESLLESELFGHVKGAFTGAVRDKKGRFELADGGTIFLDEIGDIPPSMQVKLLRVLQEGRFERVGSEKTLKVDVRVISATNKDLSAEIAEGRFREDLYYRLSVVPLGLPPLRERRNDIPLLVEHILAQILRDIGRDNVKLSPEALDIMMSYDWPGNVRELQNWLQFSLVKCRGKVILPEHLPPAAGGKPAPRRRSRKTKLDAESVRAAIRKANGNKVEAARLLGVSRATLYRFFDKNALDG